MREQDEEVGVVAVGAAVGVRAVARDVEVGCVFVCRVEGERDVRARERGVVEDTPAWGGRGVCVGDGVRGGRARGQERCGGRPGE